MREQIQKLASRYQIQIIYAFGSRAKEALAILEGEIPNFSAGPSDLDLGIKSSKLLSVEEKAKIAIFFEDLFHLSRVDVVVIPEVPALLALEIVTGEILCVHDPTYEAEYQLYIMKRAADLLPHERTKQAMILGGFA
ncbi:MAG: nucleotidyltransferase domain-containing protein [Deltaproteobacteria bacterium]|nr:MAG: nucleotidyltransferase domain-containing protein [Deltaproteobacteria bacterium]